MSDSDEGFYRPNEIATHKLGHEVFEPVTGFFERKGAMYPLSLSVRLGRRLKEEG